jgi:hypothetical protein
LGILIYNVPKLKQTNRRDRIVYGMLVIPTIYLSLIFVMDIAWPSLDELVHFFFLKPAQQIVEAIKLTK